MKPPWSLLCSAWSLGRLSPLLAWIKVTYLRWGRLSLFSASAQTIPYSLYIEILLIWLVWILFSWRVKLLKAAKSLTCSELLYRSVQSLRCVRLFGTPWTAARQASLSITNSQSLLKLMSIESVMPSNHLILCRQSFFSCLQSSPASESFQMNQLFASGGQSIGVSASTSVLPMNTQDWSPLGWTGWVSLQSKGLSRVFSNTQFKSINSSVLSFLYSPTLTSIHDYKSLQSRSESNPHPYLEWG